MEMRKRTILKTITFRIIATITTMILILIFTGNLALAGAVGSIDMVAKIVIYYIHERVWNKTKWGMRKL
jgi:uncharacterized membrane protein